MQSLFVAGILYLHYEYTSYYWLLVALWSWTHSTAGLIVIRSGWGQELQMANVLKEKDMIPLRAWYQTCSHDKNVNPAEMS